VDIWHDGQLEGNVKLHDHFILITESDCRVSEYLLQPESDPSDAFNILFNGSIHLPNQTEGATQSVFGLNQFCVMSDKVTY
jgi:hypothetical protein